MPFSSQRGMRPTIPSSSQQRTPLKTEKQTGSRKKRSEKIESSIFHNTQDRGARISSILDNAPQIRSEQRTGQSYEATNRKLSQSSMLMSEEQSFESMDDADATRDRMAQLAAIEARSVAARETLKRERDKDLQRPPKEMSVDHRAGGTDHTPLINSLLSDLETSLRIADYFRVKCAEASVECATYASQNELLRARADRLRSTLLSTGPGVSFTRSQSRVLAPGHGNPDGSQEELSDSRSSNSESVDTDRIHTPREDVQQKPRAPSQPMAQKSQPLSAQALLREEFDGSGLRAATALIKARGQVDALRARLSRFEMDPLLSFDMRRLVFDGLKGMSFLGGESAVKVELREGDSGFETIMPGLLLIMSAMQNELFYTKNVSEVAEAYGLTTPAILAPDTAPPTQHELCTDVPAFEKTLEIEPPASIGDLVRLLPAAKDSQFRTVAQSFPAVLTKALKSAADVIHNSSLDVVSRRHRGESITDAVGNLVRLKAAREASLESLRMQLSEFVETMDDLHTQFLDEIPDVEEEIPSSAFQLPPLLRSFRDEVSTLLNGYSDRLESSLDKFEGFVGDIQSLQTQPERKGRKHVILVKTLVSCAELIQLACALLSSLVSMTRVSQVQNQLLSLEKSKQAELEAQLTRAAGARKKLVSLLAGNVSTLAVQISTKALSTTLGALQDDPLGSDLIRTALDSGIGNIQAEGSVAAPLERLTGCVSSLTSSVADDLDAFQAFMADTCAHISGALGSYCALASARSHRQVQTDGGPVMFDFACLKIPEDAVPPTPNASRGARRKKKGAN
eukprot:gnl/Chilomastix_cuspidata/1979.p1 GENE.gnl/Chilomastix_cuspidata/1979~~gnl/Chilomastix_cuspidata/1979.p1  ORF type:complete len:833 (-),score=131.08 gnl/Chilomastix_cuspidata/1979:747-3134(-)